MKKLFLRGSIGVILVATSCLALASTSLPAPTLQDQILECNNCGSSSCTCSVKGTGGYIVATYKYDSATDFDTALNNSPFNPYYWSCPDPNQSSFTCTAMSPFP